MPNNTRCGYDLKKSRQNLANRKYKNEKTMDKKKFKL